METALDTRQVRQVYLITYSRAAPELVDSRQTFARYIVDSFQHTPDAPKVLQWVCSQEKHHDGGIHYHMAVKLERCYRWLQVRHRIKNNYGIDVHFSDNHYHYFSAWQYVTKEDPEALVSDGHPDLSNHPRTTRACQANHESEDGGSRKRQKKTRLSAYEVSQIAFSKGIRTRLQLLALANQQKNEGKTDLAEFVVNRGKKVVNEAIEVCTPFFLLHF